MGAQEAFEGQGLVPDYDRIIGEASRDEILTAAARIALGIEYAIDKPIVASELPTYIPFDEADLSDGERAERREQE